MTPDKIISLYIALLDYANTFVTLKDTTIRSAYIQILRPIPNVSIINVGDYAYKCAPMHNPIHLSARSTYTHVKLDVERYVRHKMDDIDHVLLCK